MGAQLVFVFGLVRGQPRELAEKLVVLGFDRALVAFPRAVLGLRENLLVREPELVAACAMVLARLPARGEIEFRSGSRPERGDLRELAA